MKKEIKWYAGMLAMSVLCGCAVKNDNIPVDKPVQTEQEMLTTEEVTTKALLRQLSLEELQELEKYLDQMENYGFLLSVYESPTQVDLNEVFYVGAGMEISPMSEEEVQAYLKAAEMDEIYTDVIHLTTAQIDGVLQKKLGVTLQDMESEFSWIYVPEYDSYYHQAGDTNWMSWKCVSGTETEENIIILEIESDWDNEFNCEVMLKRSEKGYQFMANRLRE